MILGALVSVWMRGLLSSVITVGAVGLGLCVMFLFLKAPDLAITQLVVEILMLVILIRATIRRGVSRMQCCSSAWVFLVFAVFGFILLTASYYAFTELPAFGNAAERVSQFYIQNAIAKTKAANIVSAIILDFRAYDTLGEATILFTSVIGVLALMRRKGRKYPHERDEPDC